MAQTPLSNQFQDDIGALDSQSAKTAFDQTASTSSSLEMVPDNAQLGSIPSQGGGRDLRQLLLITILPLALIPLGIEGLISYFISRNQAEAQLTAEVRGQARLADEIISENLQDEFDLAELLTKNPVIYRQARQGASQAAADNLVSRAPDDLEAEFSANKLLSPSQELNDFLVNTAESEDFAEIIVTEKNGFTVGYNTITSDFIQSDEAWWQQARDQGLAISEPGFDESAGAFGLDVSQKMVDPDDGSFLGVLKIFITSLEFDELNSYLADAGIEGSQQLEVIDASSQLSLARYNEAGQQVPDSVEAAKEIIGGETIGAIAQQITAEDASNPESVKQQLQTQFPIKNVEVEAITLAGTEADADTPDSLLVSFNYAGKYYTMATMDLIDWVSVASIDTAEIRAAGRESLIKFALLALALGAVATFATISLAQRLSSPLKSLAMTAQQVSEGNLNVMASVQGTAESQTLATTFNNLVQGVKGFLQKQTANTRLANLSAAITGADVSSEADLMPVFETLVTEARDIIGSERMVVYQFKPDWGGTIVAESLDQGLPSAFKQGLDDPCIPEATRDKYLSDGILLENDVAAAKFHPEHLQLLKNLKVKSILGIPIVSQGRLYGLLITHHCSAPHTWTADEVDILRQLGLQLGLVIDRVNLLSQTQKLAQNQKKITETLQQNALQLLMDVDPISAGDLTVRARVTEDEIGTVADSYNSTIASLRKIVTQVQQASQEVATTADTNQGSIQKLSDSAAQQAVEILSALEQVQAMADSVRTVATNAEKAEAAVQQAAQTVDLGDEAMNRTVDGITAIRETVAETAKKVKRLGESSQKISNVVNLISGFAAQTNMLALNASIEASRAGESGKGFAVVAEEVRELARQSAEATTEIEKLVASIQAETNAVVVAMEAGTEQVVSGTQLVDDTRQSLNQITAVSRQISELVESIAQATVEQSAASDKVTVTMNNVAEVATQNSSEARQVSASFEQLRSVAKTLEEEVGRFKVS